MKIFKTALLSLISVILVIPFAFAAGNAEKGKTLFDNPKVFSGTAGKSCATCHPDGKGLEKSGMKGKMDWKNPAGKWTSLEDAINVCIIMANKGTAIDPKSEEMKDLVAYIKSLKPATMEKKKMK